MGKILKIREAGDPILEKQCDKVDIKNINKDILDIIEDLKATLNFGTGLGIAAPQIGENKRINPTWKKLSDDTDIQYEGCMSVPTIRGKVERYKNIELTYYNENGEKITKNLDGFFARLIQHECDHLNGIIFLEKVKGPNGFATAENIKKYSLKEERK